MKRKHNVKKTTFLMEQVSALLLHKTPSKYKDPGCPTISRIIGDHGVEQALLDLGASVNLKLYSVYLQLGIGDIKSTSVVLQLVDRSVKRLRGMIEDVLVQIDKFYYLVDFLILDTQYVVHANSNIPIILGRAFLATANALINCRNGLMKLTFGNMTLEVNIFNISKEIMGDEECEIVNWLNAIMEEEFNETYFFDPLDSCLFNSYYLDSSINFEVVDVFSLINESQIMEVNGWKQRFKELLERETLTLLSSVKVPKLELKQLSRGLKYAFFIPGDTFPIAITSELTIEQEDELIKEVKKYKAAIGWTIVDIKAVIPLICTHKNNLENDSKATRDQQHRLNITMKEVLKIEILKLLDVGITYPIANDKWISIMQVVPKKFGVIVVKKNANNELVPIKLVKKIPLSIAFY